MSDPHPYIIVRKEYKGKDSKERNLWYTTDLDPAKDPEFSWICSAVQIVLGLLSMPQSLIVMTKMALAIVRKHRKDHGVDPANFTRN